MALSVGQAAPEARFGRGQGDEVSLSELWREGPLVVAFLRHFG